MSTEIAPRHTVSTELQEKVLLSGDLSKLTPIERLNYYNNVCESLGLNALTRPFEYLSLRTPDGTYKLTLYARKDCTEQLRNNRKLSVAIVSREVVEGVYVVTARATDPAGRCDESIGAVSIDKLVGNERANAMMKAETKAKRRVTLSICGLGMLDETEVDTIKDAKVVTIPDVRTPSPQAKTLEEHRAAIKTDRYTREAPQQESEKYIDPFKEAIDKAHKQWQVDQSQQASDAPAPTSVADHACKLAQEHAGDVPTFGFGKHKGKSPYDSSVPDDYLAYIEPIMAGYIDDPAKARWKANNQALLDAVRAAALDRGIMNYDDDRR